MIMNVKKILGSNIKKYRKEAGMTQEELAEKAGISSKHLSRIEIGNTFPSSSFIDRISMILNVSLPDLFYSANAKSKPATGGDDDIEQIVNDESYTFVTRVKERIKKKYNDK
jgi:transcriptional regulator with XRE-family HTH domain